jgi:predicted membrane protein
MKHPHLFPIWAGIFFIIFGTTMLLNAILGIHIPIGRILCGLLLCYAGLHCITRRHRHHRVHRCCDFCHDTDNSTTLNSTILELNEDVFRDKEPFEYTTTLGTTIIDLTNVYPREDLPKKKHTIMLDTVLGKTILKINKSYAFCIHIQGTGAHVELPHGQKKHIRNHVFCNPEGCTNPDLEIHAHTTFGSLEIELV